MSFTFNQGYREPISSFKMNEKIDRIYGANGVLTGFDLEKSQGNVIKVINKDVDHGEAIVNGTLVKYELAKSESPIFLGLANGTWYIYGLYSVYEKVFVIKAAATLEEAQGTWKVFLGHVVVVNGEITEFQGLVPTSDTTKDVIYRKLTTLAILARYVYDANGAVLQSVLDEIIKYVGKKTDLTTNNKATIVSAINEIKLDLDGLIEDIGDELNIPNFALKEVNKTNNTINCFQMKQFTSDTNIKGFIKIKLPIDTFNNEIINLTIRGISSTKTQGFLLQLTGMLNSADSRWANCKAYTLGELPCNSVTFARNQTDGIYILLGESDLEWGKLNLALESILVVSNTSQTEYLWRDNWEIENTPTPPTATTSITTTIKTGGPQGGEYVDPTRQVKAGTGLTGGGPLSSDVTLSANFGTGVNQVARGNHTHDNYAPKKFEGKTYKVLVTDGTGSIITSEDITTEELNTLDGVTGNIQQQLNSKAGTNHTHSYLPLTGGTVSGDLNVTGNIKTKTFYIGSRQIVIKKLQPTDPTENMIWFNIGER